VKIQPHSLTILEISGLVCLCVGEGGGLLGVWLQTDLPGSLITLNSPGQATKLPSIN